MSYQMNFAKDIDKAMEALDLMSPSGESHVLLADYAVAHLDAEVIARIKDKGHVLIMHQGGPTPVAQINDTDIRSQLELLWAMERQQRQLRPAELDWLRFARKLSQLTQ